MQPPRPLLRHAVVAALSLATLAAVVPAAATPRLRTDFWGTDGTIYAMVRSGSTLYVGGAFSMAGPMSGCGVVTDAASGDLVRPFPRVAGYVTAAIPDGHGGWFIGGAFAFVEGQPRGNLAHIRSDGTLDPWAPTVGGPLSSQRRWTLHPSVYALVLRGSTLYAGGCFTIANGSATHRNLAAFDARTGALLPWNPDANDHVRCLVLHRGRLYAAGTFTAMGSAPRGHLAAVDPATGVVSPWRADADGTVLDIAPAGGTLYVGGEFVSIGGLARNALAAVDAETGAVLGWDPALEPGHYYIAHGSWSWPFVARVRVQGNSVYVGGYFSSAGGEPRRNLAALDVRTARAQPFAPVLDYGSVMSMEVRGRAVYVGGGFNYVAGRLRVGAAAVDAVTGAPLAWDPELRSEVWGANRMIGSNLDAYGDGMVSALAVDGDRVYVGGGFRFAQVWEMVGGAFSIDLETGGPGPWRPDIGGGGWGGYASHVAAIALQGNTAYLGGDFRNVGGQPTSGFAAVDAVTGAPQRWDTPLGLPYYSGLLPTIAPAGDRIYAAGAPFGMAALQIGTGATLDWHPVADGWVTALVPTDGVVYAAGLFHHIGGVARDGLAALDAVTGGTVPWNPPGVQGVDQLILDGNTMLLGGCFSFVGGLPRPHLAAIDIPNAAVLPWNPTTNGWVRTLALDGRTLWAGGEFDTLGGARRPFLAALEAGIGTVSNDVPAPSGPVFAVTAAGDTVCVGGSFLNVDGYPCGGIAVLMPDRTTPPARAASVHAAGPTPPALSVRCEPNPVRPHSALAFTLPSAGPVSLAVYDVQGRCLARLLDGERLPPGAHALALPARAWPPGCYLVRIEAGGRRSTSKMVVMP